MTAPTETRSDHAVPPDGLAGGGPPPAVNPLAELCRVLGLTAKHAAQVAGVPPSAMRAALSDPAPPVLDAYFRLCEGIGARLRLRMAEPFELALDLAALDALYVNAGFRLAQRLPAPSEDADAGWTRRGVRRLVVHQRQRLGKSYREIEHFLEQGHVCTIEGNRDWLHTTVAQHVKQSRRRFDDDDEPVRPGAAALADWRAHLVQLVAGEAYPRDPMVFMRYDMLPAAVRGGDLVLTPRQRVPAVVHRWLADGLLSVQWLAGAWALQKLPTVPPPATPPAPGPVAPAPT